ncbi:unnamed protein product [Ranitomeya imitator]|uniref:PH domain-containing protein n=1 Tax=Ranitomeya imitator TaxID=111125 RepID=A0ABN9MM67_9NEOB|nr:unnamed protein product [Ranitomeya imitator]
MEKTGPTQRERFKKRWFNLDSEERKLLYYRDPLDPYEQGGIFIGSCEAGYHVTEGLPNGMKGTSGRRESQSTRPSGNTSSPVRAAESRGTGCTCCRRSPPDQSAPTIQVQCPSHSDITGPSDDIISV